MFAGGPSMDDYSRRVLAIESWDGGSHRAVRQSIERHAALQWTWICLPPGPWRWRQRLGMLEAVDAMRTAGVLDKQWDCIVCTSLLPAGELRGLLPKALRDTPIVLMMHENQVAYPDGVSGAEPRDVHAAVTDLTSLVGADAVLWTSRWNQRSCLEGLAGLLKDAPWHGAAAAIDAISAKSQVIWPPVEDPLASAAAAEDRLVHNCDNNGRDATPEQLVAWPHRHQHDKGLDELASLAATHTSEWTLQWALLGERRGPVPTGIKAFREAQQGRIVVDGYVDRNVYLSWLGRADWVLSTAQHEFFGIAVVEALLAGCLPWLPARLSYPELLPEEARGLHPGMAFSVVERNALQAAVRDHLRPAIAPEAVRLLEHAIVCVCTVD